MECRGETLNHGRLLYHDRSHAEDGLQDVRGTSVLQRPKRSGDRKTSGGVCSAPTEAKRKMGRVRSGGPHATSRPSRRRDLEPWGACHAITEALRKTGCKTSGGTSVLQRPSRRRDLEPWAPAPQQSEPCGRWGARHPGDVCSAPTGAERRPWTHGDKVRFRF